MMFLVTLFLSLCILLADAFVLTKLWVWYLASALSLNPLSMFTAFGIVLIVHLLKPRSFNTDAEWSDFLIAFVLHMLTTLFCLSLGFVGTLFV